MFNGSLRRAFGLPTPPTPGTSGGCSDPFDDDLNTNRPRTGNTSDDANKDLPPPPYDSDEPSSPLRTQNLNAPRTNPSPTSSSDQLARDEAERARRRRPRRPDVFSMLQPIGESSSSLSSAPASTPFRPSVFGLDSSYAKRMEETGRLRKLQSQQQLKSASADTLSSITDPPVALSPSQSHSIVPSDDDASFVSKLSVNPLPTPPAEPTPTTLDIDSHLEDMKALQNLLDDTLSELKAAKAETEQVRTRHAEDKKSLMSRLKASEEELAKHIKRNTSHAQTINDLTSKLKNTNSDMTTLAREKRTWQQKLDSMHHRLHRAERQVRCLDHVTRAKVDARQDGLLANIKRSAQLVSTGPSAEIIGAVTALNEEVLQIANLFVENLERSNLRGVNHLARATDVLGDGIAGMMETQAEDQSPRFRLLLMQVALEAFMVHWSSMIIEGWYPKQQSFADVLLELSAQTLATSGGSQIHCGKPIKILQTQSTSAIQAKFPEWVKDVLHDLAQILLLGGLKMRAQRASLFSSKMLALVKMAYDLRAALAEKDLCGGVELALVAPDTLFQQKWMEEAHATTRARGTAVAPVVHMERVAGTCGLGLQIPVGESRSQGVMASLASSSSAAVAPTMVLKPKVVLLRVLQESP